MALRLLFVGDVFSRYGRAVLEQQLPALKAALRVDLCVVNGENAAGGKGITHDMVHQFQQLGADAITLGNHAWDNKSIFSFIDDEPRLVRALNYPEQAPGQGITRFTLPSGQPVAVIQVLLRLFMNPLDCPFDAMNKILPTLPEDCITLVDMHGEATSEKVAMGWFLDGHVSALVGTHTHIPTADERVLPQGTAYITDVGMTGPQDSVIGLDVDTAVQGFLTGIRQPMRIAKENVKLNAVLIEVDETTGRALSIERIVREYEDNR